MPNITSTGAGSRGPGGGKTRTARLTLRLGRKPFPSTAYARVARVRVDTTLYASTRIELLLRDEEGTFSRSHPIALGDPLSVILEWSDGSSSTPLARGEVSGLGTEFSSEGTYLKVIGHGLRYRLQHGTVTAAFQRLTSGQVMTQAAMKRRIQVQARGARTRHPHHLIANRTLARLLEEASGQAGLVLAEEGGGATTSGVTPSPLQVQPLRLSGQAIPLTFGQTLHDIRVEVNSIAQVSQVKVYGVDLLKHAALVGRAGAPDALGLVGPDLSGASAAQRAFGKSLLQRVDCPVRSVEEARALARALFNERLFQFVTAWGRASGCPELKVGGLVALEGLGRKLSGKYLITRLEHVYQAGDPGGGLTDEPQDEEGLGFQTRFEASRPAIGRA